MPPGPDSCLPEARTTEQPDLTIAGSREAARALIETIAVFPFGPASAPPPKPPLRPGEH